MSNIGMVIKAIIYKANEPITGYEITKRIKSKTGNQHQQVYRELAKIAKRPDVVVERVYQKEKPDKKVYSFKKQNDFEVECSTNSDFSKTSVAYALLLNDVMYGTDLYDGYCQLMKQSEQSFFITNEKHMVLEPLIERSQLEKADHVIKKKSS